MYLLRNLKCVASSNSNLGNVDFELQYTKISKLIDTNQTFEEEDEDLSELKRIKHLKDLRNTTDTKCTNVDYYDMNIIKHFNEHVFYFFKCQTMFYTRTENIITG